VALKVKAQGQTCPLSFDLHNLVRRIII